MGLITTIKNFFTRLFSSKKSRTYMFSEDMEEKIKEINKQMDDLIKKNGGKL